MALQVLRIVAVLALLGAAAAVATPKGRLPLALRGLTRLLCRDLGVAPSASAKESRVSPGRRLFAFALVILALLAALAL